MEILNAKHWQRPTSGTSADIQASTRAILEAIRSEGDRAIARYSLQFDGFEPKPIQLQPWDSYELSQADRDAISHAAERIEAFCRLQKSMYRDVELIDDCGQFSHRIVPIERMAAYIPGGRFPLISTALMTLIPARVAGVANRIALSPSDHPALLAAASLAGATDFLHIGGAQAIASAAFGYGHFQPVDMVVGPGNAFVNEAKAQLQRHLKIDTLAGPSELLILADETADSEWICLDMLAQAEHDPQALSVLASTDRNLLTKVQAQLEQASKREDVQEIGAVSLVFAEDLDELVAFSDRMAPEHLHVHMPTERLDSTRLTQYGSLFLGAHSAVAFGDYCSGPNHTLPTSGYARMKGGLQVGDFYKIQTVQSLTAQGAQALASTGEALASLEGLHWHARSMATRRE